MVFSAIFLLQILIFSDFRKCLLCKIIRTSGILLKFYCRKSKTRQLHEFGAFDNYD